MKGKIKMYKTKRIEKWIGYDFETDELKKDRIFRVFARMFQAEIESQLAEKKYEIVIYIRGNFYISGFISNCDRTRYVYFAVPDVRYTRNWHKQVLVREAKNRHDYIGGINNYTSLENFGEAVNKLMNGRSYL